ncbi:hypothetical protein RF11_15873 [Thelohanellus kitauei]|uniref:ISXO2-like transposase domain-containing protein n=1 Tax=Thelohanellus kitauei TaxID=669202 RepID=A0A0C2N8Q3_THEKT|nr:hypothetical protein RF11_15873 [Thelohanellus kitauei]
MKRDDVYCVIYLEDSKNAQGEYSLYKSTEELCSLIHHLILPGTTKISDKMKSYRDLNNQGYWRLRVNQCVNLVDPDTGAYTNNIERIWIDVRTTIPMHKLRKIPSSGYLTELLFKR